MAIMMKSNGAHFMFGGINVEEVDLFHRGSSVPHSTHRRDDYLGFMRRAL
jgi:hypothetical protein